MFASTSSSRFAETEMTVFAEETTAEEVTNPPARSVQKPRKKREKKSRSSSSRSWSKAQANAIRRIRLRAIIRERVEQENKRICEDSLFDPFDPIGNDEPLPISDIHHGASHSPTEMRKFVVFSDGIRPGQGPSSPDVLYSPDRWSDKIKLEYKRPDQDGLNDDENKNNPQPQRGILKTKIQI